MICTADMDLHFMDKHHEAFFRRAPMDDEKGKLLAYTLGADPTTREHFGEIYDGKGIRSGCWKAGWNTTKSRLLIAWAMAMTGELETPAAAGGTLVPCLLASLQWSDSLEGE